MYSVWKAVPATAVLALVFGSAANAADMGPLPSESSLPPLLQSAPLLVDEFSSGWYLRGDVGYRFNNIDSVTNAGAPPTVGNYDLDESWLLGAGIGYKWEWFRTDFTLDYGTRADFNGDSSIRPNDYRANIDSVTGLLNVYGDLGTWFGFTPYVGLGAGFAHLQTSDLRLASAGGPPLNATSDWNFAWAYMAGVSYRIMGNAHLDLSYRHVDMGDVTSGRDRFGNRVNFDKVSSDEVRLGFRYTLD